MPLEQQDLERIERVVYKNADDSAVSIDRSFERLHQRIDAAETRIYSRLADVEEQIESSRSALTDSINDVREDIRHRVADEM